VKLDVKPDRLHCTVTGPDGVAIVLDADYVVSKDGVVVGILRAKTAVKPNDEDALKDRLFYFRVLARERALRVSDLNCGGDDDGQTRDVLEGTYMRHDGKHGDAALHSGKSPRSRTGSKTASEPGRAPELLNESFESGPIGASGQTSSTAPASQVTPYRVTGSIEYSDSTATDEWQRIWRYFTPGSETSDFDCANWVGP
jgi:hypothetical protein